MGPGRLAFACAIASAHCTLWRQRVKLLDSEQPTQRVPHTDGHGSIVSVPLRHSLSTKGTASGTLIERNLLPGGGGIDPRFRQLLIDETEIAPLGVVRG